ncbi:MAG: oligosaccharide flippase family protein [Cylindrospermopsis raciborskii KL1]|jgi:O-antigen/teichoic acid export membrane protein|uniref:oligosaccharide flippase family protein n=1 Tax=Cylindrospermopsis raciborskii TaxID=77022 RepID=UPI001A30D2E0|nr:oligosaccharide flippase family protein [Cylindrospermopsis raciborskii]MBG0744576.1 oligosaccharide flippase family protein [Cylindrospermopsis raciborskii KL1]
MVRNGIYNLVGALIRASTGLATVPILSRLMGLEEYGLWALISSILSLLTVVEAGLSNTATVFLSKDLSEQDNLKVSHSITVIMSFMLVLAVLASLLLYSNAPAVISFFPKLDHQQYKDGVLALQIGSFSILLQLLQQVFIGIEQAYQEYRLLSILKTLQFTLLSLGWITIAFQGGNSVTLTIWQLAVSSLIFVAHISVFGVLTKKQDLKIAWDKEKAIVILRYNLVMWSMTLGGLLFTRGDRIIVGSTLGVESLGIYAVVSDIASGINFLVAQPIQPLLPFISGLNPNLDSSYLDQLKNRLKRVIQLNGCMASWCGSLVLIFSPLVIKFAIPLNSTTEKTALLCLYFLSIITTLQSLCGTGYYVLMSENVKYLSSLLFSSGFLSLLLIYLGSISYGLIGATLGNLAFSAMIISTFVSTKKFGLDYKVTFYCMATPVFPFLLICLLNLLFGYTHIVFSCLLIFQSALAAGWLFKLLRVSIKNSS